ncbi:Amino acid exporter family protein, LeuE-type [Desulfonema limicola]|uniref:Amino acid exporter family protein, LeuE-type n=1 Tax=Desulfonema limicola TaxID=45656 RepID=A0A975B8I1_9BACT|nr:LysE family transporter [Desulfonema limicola]QTA80881.1 Amino acid exporter family protein, LeuE-type [Desulfonema limicola]
MELLTIFSTSFVLALSGAVMPGPLFTVTVSESSIRGFWAGPLLIAGHGILELVLVIGLMLGLAPFLNQKEFFAAAAMAGSVILMWMAWGMFRSLGSLSLENSGGVRTGRNLVFSGALLSIVNPYWTIWWASIGLGYVLHSMEAGKWGVFVFFWGHILGDLFWYSAVSAAVYRGRSLLSDRAYQCLIGACAVFLAVFSCLFAYSGFKKFIA